ncbi:hypothetical protein M513_07141, partial [Trichuris suis]
ALPFIKRKVNRGLPSGSAHHLALGVKKDHINHSMSVPVLVFVATTKQLSIGSHHLSCTASLQAMLLKALALCISAVLAAAEQVNMELTDDSTFVDQAIIRQAEPTKMEIEFVEETARPLESANGLEITELTEDVANLVRPQESRQRASLPLLGGNYLPTPRHDVAYAAAGYSSGQRTSLPPFRKAYSPAASVPSGYNVMPMADVNYGTGCAGPSVRSSGPTQVMSSYIAAPPSVPYSQQGAVIRTGYGRRRKRSPTLLALRQLLKG